MSEPSLEKQKELALCIAATANESEKEALRFWIEQLLEIKASNLSAIQKAKKAILITSNSKVVLPVVKMIARETKRLAWNNRSLKGRLGLGGAVIGLTFFGGQGAGIAALGTAIGVPLWVVFGAGAAFLGVLYEEIAGNKENPKTTYQIINAEPEERRK